MSRAQPLPKLICVCTRLNVGGITPQVVDLVRGLQNDFDAEIACGRIEPDEQDMTYLAESKGVGLMRVPTLRRRISPLDDMRTLWRLYRMFRRERPVVVTTFMFKARLLGSLAARLARVPVVIETFNGTLFDEYFKGVAEKVLLTAERFVARRMVDSVIVTTSSDHDMLVRHGIVGAERITVVPYGFDLDDFARQVEEGADRFRPAAAIASDALLVGCVGRLVPIKGHRYLLEALHQLRRSDRVPDDMHLVLVGDGELRHDLELFAKELEVDDIVTFLGARRDMPEIYAALDLLVVPSLNEGTCIVVAEAMAAGVPAVGSAVGGIVDLIENERTGLLVPSRDPSALADALDRLLHDRAARDSFGAAARERVLERFRLEGMVAATSRVYAGLMERARR